MATDQKTLTLENRTVLRKGLNRLRAEGLVPAVIHDHGKDSVHVTVPYIEMMKMYRDAGKHHPVSLKVGAKNYMAMIKDVDFEPKKYTLRHVVFNAVKQNEKVEAEIPITFEEVEIPAEKVSLMVLKQLDHVLVEALPHQLPDEIMVDPSTLAEVGDRLTIADLKVPEGVVVLTEPETQIAMVEQPKDQIAEADRAKAELEEAMGQVTAEVVDESAEEQAEGAQPAGQDSGSKE